jgi:hypothetical protein
MKVRTRNYKYLWEPKGRRLLTEQLVHLAHLVYSLCLVSSFSTEICLALSLSLLLFLLRSVQCCLIDPVLAIRLPPLESASSSWSFTSEPESLHIHRLS